MSNRSSPSRGGGGGGANPGFSLGREEVDKVGQALISKAITSKQLDATRQYDDDSSAVGSSLEAMDGALDDLSNDVKELGRCLKSSAFATAQLQKVQERINGQIKDMLRREKAKMEIKEKSILSLDKKLRKIEKNQNKILFGYKMYKYLRVAVIILLLWGIIGTVFSFSSVTGDDPEGARRRVLVADAEKNNLDERMAFLLEKEEAATTRKAKQPMRLLHSLSSAGEPSVSVPAIKGDGRRDCACL
jgi:hypothetical protein